LRLCSIASLRGSGEGKKSRRSRTEKGEKKKAKFYARLKKSGGVLPEMRRDLIDFREGRLAAVGKGKKKWVKGGHLPGRLNAN